MERESFEDREIGQILSDNFVCIKLDREERPDVDKVYMTFVQVGASGPAPLVLDSSDNSLVCVCCYLQATNGSGGWPMSVWLTPDLRPFIGGTYFPPRDHGRRPGLKTVLTRIIDQVFILNFRAFYAFICPKNLWSHWSQWRNNRSALESNGNKILEALKKGTAIAADAEASPPFAPDVAKRCFKQLAHSYEEEYGGFREAPKFPSPGEINPTPPPRVCLTPSVASQ